MLDITLLRIMKDRTEYKRLLTSIPMVAMDEKTQVLLKDFGKYSRKFPKHDTINFQVFLPVFKRWHSDINTDSFNSYVGVIRTITKCTVTEDTKDGILSDLYELNMGTKLANAFRQYDAGEMDEPLINTVSKIVDTYKANEKSQDIKWIDTPISEILSDVQKNKGLKWRLDILNKYMRPLRGGDFGVLASRPDRGKTTMVASEITFMARQVPKHKNVLWLNNEGAGKRLIPRLYQAALGCTLSELGRKNKAGTIKREYIKAVGRIDKIRVIDIHELCINQLETIFDNSNPGLVVLDMLDHVYGFGNMSRTDLQLEELYKWVRNKAVKYDCPFIGTSQISGDGEGMQFPAMDKLKDSRCLAKDTPVRMYDGTTKFVQDINVGDKVLGMDSRARNVTGLGSGTEMMYTITGEGWHFSCNESHILTCIKSTCKPMNGHKQGDILDISLQYFLKYPSRLCHYKAIQVKAQYLKKVLPIEPYLFGLWLGDGSMRDYRITTADKEILTYLEALPNYKHTYKQKGNAAYDVYLGSRKDLRIAGVWMNKHIPLIYKTSSIEQRQALLAGLIDSDGTVDHGAINITMAREQLIYDIEEVARSLGYKTSVYKKKPRAWLLSISNTDILPVKLSRKQTLCIPFYTRMSITKKKVEKYYGITVDGDSRYTLGNYIATHNTGKQGACDFIMMIGASSDIGLVNSRFISLPKNKLGLEGKPKDPRAEVQINVDTNRYEDICE